LNRPINGVFTDGIIYHFLRLQDGVLYCHDGYKLSIDEDLDQIFYLMTVALKGDVVFSSLVRPTTTDVGILLIISSFLRFLICKANNDEDDFEPAPQKKPLQHKVAHKLKPASYVDVVTAKTIISTTTSTLVAPSSVWAPKPALVKNKAPQSTQVKPDSMPTKQHPSLSLSKQQRPIALLVAHPPQPAPSSSKHPATPPSTSDAKKKKARPNTQLSPAERKKLAFNGSADAPIELDDSI
jgi:hypothetical protein